MAMALIPIFESYDRFLGLDPDSLDRELPVIIRFLESFPKELRAIDGYRAVKGFLSAHADVEPTFNSYPTNVERLLLWTLLVRRRPLLELTPEDCRDFMAFCASPPAEWIGPVVKGRYIRCGESRAALPADTYIVNPKWRPFNLTVRKEKRKHAWEQGEELVFEPFKMKQSSIRMVFAVGGNFFEWAAIEGLAAIKNPFYAIKGQSKFRTNVVQSKANSLTAAQWNYVLETALWMADQNPDAHERTLFIIATMYSMYLRIIDMVGPPGRLPVMSDFRQDAQGEWWLYVMGKDNQFERISVRDEYMDVWMARYRKFLRMAPAPSPDDDSPLLTTRKGRQGLSGRYIGSLVQGVFDKAFERMRAHGFSAGEIQDLRSASLHWLRDTSAKADARSRDHKDLQTDLRHYHAQSTIDRYYQCDDVSRHRSSKHLSIRGYDDLDSDQG